MPTETTTVRGRPKAAKPADLDPTRPAPEIAAKYGVSVPVAYRWLAESGVQLRQGPNRHPAPPDFDPTMKTSAACAKYGVCDKTVRRWREKA